MQTSCETLPWATSALQLGTSMCREGPRLSSLIAAAISDLGGMYTYEQCYAAYHPNGNKS